MVVVTSLHAGQIESSHSSRTVDGDASSRFLLFDADSGSSPVDTDSFEGAFQCAIVVVGESRLVCASQQSSLVLLVVVKGSLHHTSFELINLLERNEIHLFSFLY